VKPGPAKALPLEITLEQAKTPEDSATERTMRWSGSATASTRGLLMKTAAAPWLAIAQSYELRTAAEYRGADTPVRMEIAGIGDFLNLP
jgi:hypothetical protein